MMKLVLLKKMMEMNKSVCLFCNALEKISAIFDQIFITNIQLSIIIFYNIAQRSIRNI